MIRMVRRWAGFTLIELMIVLVIVGILASVAYPAYTESVRESRRSEARSNLLELAEFMERYYASNGRYVTQAGGNQAPQLPYTQSPKDSATKYYNLVVVNASGSQFELNAVPIGAMAGDRCGSLTYTHQGIKGSTSGDRDDCWGR